MKITRYGLSLLLLLHSLHFLAASLEIPSVAIPIPSEKEIAEIQEQAQAKTNTKGDTELILATRRGDLSLINYFIKHNPEQINKINGKGVFSPLIAAITKDNLPAVELLVAHGADVNQKPNKGAFPIEQAAGNNAMLKFLLKHGADPKIVDIWGDPIGWSIVLKSIRNKDEEMLSLLQNDEFDLNAPNALGETLLSKVILNACKHNEIHENLLHFIMHHKSLDVNVISVFPQTSHGNPNQERILNFEGQKVSPLYAAVTFSNLKKEPKLAEALINAGADINFALTTSTGTSNILQYIILDAHKAHLEQSHSLEQQWLYVLQRALNKNKGHINFMNEFQNKASLLAFAASLHYAPAAELLIHANDPLALMLRPAIFQMLPSEMQTYLQPYRKFLEPLIEEVNTEKLRGVKAREDIVNTVPLSISNIISGYCGSDKESEAYETEKKQLDSIFQNFKSSKKEE